MAAIAQNRFMAQRQHLLAAVYRMDNGGRLAATASAAAQSPGHGRASGLGDGDCRLRQCAGKKGGAHTGPNPVDRGKRGCKRHIITTGSGIPLLVTCTPANVRDDVPFLSMLDTMPPVKRLGPGAPRYKPQSVMGDAGYGFAHIIPQVVERRIRPLLAPRGKAGYPVAHGSGLGRVRYVVERTIAWLASFRRINHCYERTGKAWQAFNELACCVICAGKLATIARTRLAA
jgi:transposase